MDLNIPSSNTRTDGTFLRALLPEPPSTKGSFPCLLCNLSQGPGLSRDSVCPGATELSLRAVALD